ncbi:MAG: hypothetical protein SP1CHLAM54_00040 [Chlamydiia bacterium]|nr:hypothetical protein [Chlamydiia bacterium]MCH9614930.1 hypothetical protein [Chlamydiia bacterium]MCH9629877.1 hypothetical protein [Chlamydiia bacterium]
MLDGAIDGIDRVIIQVDSKNEVERLFHRLCKKLRVPKAWPVTHFPATAYCPGGFVSGGLYVGNCHVEILFTQMCGPIRRLFAKRAPRISAISLKPAMPLEEIIHNCDREWQPHSGIVDYKVAPMKLLKRKIRLLGRSQLDLAFAQESAILHQYVFLETEPVFRLKKIKKATGQWLLQQLLEVAYKAGEKPLFFFTRYADLYLNPESEPYASNPLVKVQLNPIPVDMEHPQLEFEPNQHEGIYALEFEKCTVTLADLASMIL